MSRVSSLPVVSSSSISRCALLFLLVLAPGVPGCKYEMSRPHMKDLQVREYRQTLPKSDCRVLIELEGAIEEVNLDQTIWDDEGPKPDREFPGKIGYVQTYRFKPMTPEHLIAGDPDAVQTRTVIPFGRLLTEKLQKAVTASFRSSAVCQRAACEHAAGRTFDAEIVVEPELFTAWEKPTNHMNYRAQIVSYTLGGEGGRQDEQRMTPELLEQKVGRLWSRSGTFVDGLQESANTFADMAVAGIVADAARRCEMARGARPVAR